MKIKFALVLSVSSMMGLQASEAARVNCPTYESVVESEKIEDHGTYKKYSYGVQTGGDKEILLTGHRKNKPNPDVHYSVRAFKTAESVGCKYIAQTSGHGWYDIMLQPKDGTAFANCTPIAVPGGTDYFNCD
jgi:hypothetical protein